MAWMTEGIIVGYDGSPGSGLRFTGPPGRPAIAGPR